MAHNQSLLESFPLPPSFVPPSPLPTSNGNPPPSGPPSSPLPPVPGPSRISEQDTLVFLSSRRSSKYSVASLTGTGRPTSTFSVDSSANHADPPRNSMSSSISTPSLSHKFIATSRAARRARTPVSMSPPQGSVLEETFPTPRQETYGDLDLQEFGPARPQTPPIEETGDDSLSMVSMHDLPADEDEDDGPELDLSLFHKQHRIDRTRSASHRELLHSQTAPPPPVPASCRQGSGVKAKSSSVDVFGRADSPDLSLLISTTPRPRRSSSAHTAASRSSSKGGNAPRQRARTPRRVSDGTRRSDGTKSYGSGSRSSGGASSDRSSMGTGQMRKSWGDEDEDYGVQIQGRFSGVMDAPGVNSDEEQDIVRLDRDVSDSGTDSDSSLDLHTPLPHLMLRHGVLSPHSKLLSPATSDSSLSVLDVPTAEDGRPSSVFSTVSSAHSMLTKSGLMKDSRDTPTRKVRHRDGKTLRGGIGLTTGLGWSDSEDEDAPSALTRRLSNLHTPSKKVPVKSLGGGVRSSSYSQESRSRSRASSLHPLSRSYSHGMLDAVSDNDDEDYDDVVQNTFSGYGAARNRKPSVPPPTAWATKAKGQQSRITSSSSAGSLPSRSTRTSSRGSNFSLEVTIPDDDHHSPRTPMGRRDRVEDPLLTPSSTASSVSIPMPKTPTDNILPPQHNSIQRPLDREKSLPSLPNPRTGSIRYGDGRPPRPSRMAKPVPSSPTPPSSSLPTSISSPLPAPARSTSLPRASLLASPRSPYAQIPTSQSARSLSGPLATPPTPSTPGRMGPPSSPATRPRMSEPMPTTTTPALPKPRPRTGAGMVYRSNGSNLQSLKLPQASASSRMPVRSTPNPQKPIAL